MKTKKMTLHFYTLALFICSLMPLSAVEVNFTGNGTFVVPADVAEITVHVWGAGGGGGGAFNSGKAGGGGGGAYAMEVIAVSAGQVFTVTVGNGGNGGDGTVGGTGSAGGNSSFDGNGKFVEAVGGAGGQGSNDDTAPGALGAGGSTGATGDVEYAGGNGATGATGGVSGGGGGAAGTGGIGGSAVASNGGTGGIGGGNGADGLAVPGFGVDGSSPGGGGSGAYGGAPGPNDGGNGAGGQVKIVSTAELIGIFKDRDLSFGAFAVEGVGTVTVAADSGGNRSRTGDIVLIGSNTDRCALFTITGASKRFAANFDVQPANIAYLANNVPIAFTIGYENQDSAANTKVYVGGTLTLAGTEPAGTYTANATISVAYE